MYKGVPLCYKDCWNLEQDLKTKKKVYPNCIVINEKNKYSVYRKMLMYKTICLPFDR